MPPLRTRSTSTPLDRLRRKAARTRGWPAPITIPLIAPRPLSRRERLAREWEAGWDRSTWSRRSWCSLASERSLASALSAWSVLSVASAGSFASVGSILSIGSSGSILSIGSSGSILSIGASGGFATIGPRDAAPEPTSGGADAASPPATEAVIRQISTLVAVAAVASAPFARRRSA